MPPIWYTNPMPPTTDTAKRRGLGPELYNEHYFRHTLPGIEHLENPELIDGATPDTVRFGNIRTGAHILDFGCGRGSLAVALAHRGCFVTGVDYSQDALRFAEAFKEKFSHDIQDRVHYLHRSMSELDFQSEFDTIVLNQVYEHLYDWELDILLRKFREALKPDGTLVISTPNDHYIRYLFPTKRIINLPTKIVKESVRVLRGKSRHADSMSKFVREIFKIRYPESEHNQLHINMQTPSSMKKGLERAGFMASVTCVDRHKNWISILTRRWWGETIWATCQAVTDSDSRRLASST
jgi:2-polyprenyl-3-methyl-5-hydroxy-6-metoxy-1,4-benzoquinol methylase